MTSEDPHKQSESTPAQPAAEGYAQSARVLAQEGRWDELAALFIECAESEATASGRAGYLVLAAKVFEENLNDLDRAYIALLTAFQDDPTNEELTAELPRLAETLGRLPELLQECMGVAPQLSPPEKQAAMYVALSTWFQEQAGDATSSQNALEAALAAEPANTVALLALLDIYKMRGDDARVAACLSAAGAATRDSELRVSYSLDAAEIYRTRLSDKDAAVEMYRRVVELAPTNRPAAEALADLAWEAKDWTTALPLFEGLAAGSGQGSAQSARQYQKAGWAAQMLGDNDRSRANYRNAYGNDPTYLPAILRWSALALAERWWEDVILTAPAVLSRDDAGLTQDERVEYLDGLGQAYLASGEAERAANAFTQAVALAPDNKECRDGLAKAHGRLSGTGPETARAMIAQQRMLLQSASSAEEKFEVLAKIAAAERDQLGDVRASLGTYFEMLTLRPDDPVTLHEVFEIYSHARDWQQAVEILERLVKVESGKTRARLLVAMGNILNYELRLSERAIEVYNLVLDEDVDDERTFGRIERILTAQTGWRELARNYRRMIKRLGADPPPEKRALLLSLWRKLGDVCRKRLHERDAAIAAYEVCVQLAPEDRRYREVLADSYEVLGAAKLNEAAKAREAVLEYSQDFDDLAKNVRALARMYGKSQMYDRLHCTSAALVAMGQAISQEQAFYERTASPAVLRSTGSLSEGMWQRFITSPRQEWCVSHVLAVVSAGVAMGRAKDAVALRLNPAQKVDLAADNSSVGQMISYACHLFNIALPPLYVSPESDCELELRIVLEGQQVMPSFLLGRNLINRTEKELAFFLARRLARLRADQFLLSPEAVPSLDELRVIVAAAVKMVHPQFQLPETDPASVKRYVAFLQRVVSPAILSSASAAIEQIVAEPGRVDVASWAVGANQSSDRAGLLLCGDTPSAVREILRSAESRGGDTEAAIKDLLRWSVSGDYLDLREQLGLVAEVPKPSAARSSEPFPRRPPKTT
jgi:tetratricopeptide (TPR) repeat protein